MIASLPKNERRSEQDFSETQALAEVSRYYLDVYGKWVHGYPPAKHHQEWIDRITAIAEGYTKRRKLLIIAPPGHAKSTWLSLVFPTWYLGKHPDQSILFFTSSDIMAHQFGGTVKLTLEENPKHLLAFPLPNCRPYRSRGWSNDGLYLVGTPDGSKDPAYRAVGYGASILGARAHGMILDDVLTQEQAQSEVEQRAAKDYFDMTVDSRLHPDGWMVAIMTRWHENDLASHLMAKPDWDLLHMPAIGHWGQDTALWPQRFSFEFLRAKQLDIGSAQFACLYQGDPSALGGSVFKAGAWFKPLPCDFHERRDDGKTLCDRLNLVQFWDLAYSAKTSADYTVAVTLGVDSVYSMYILNVFRKRIDETALDAAMAEHILTTRPRLIGIEDGAFKQASVKDLISRVVKQLNGQFACTIVPVKPSADKVTRAMLPAARAEAGTVYADRQAPWWPTFESECLGFPLAAHDDQVDALSGACQLAIEKTAMQREEPRGSYAWQRPGQRDDEDMFAEFRNRERKR